MTNELELKANQILWKMLGITEDMLSDELKAEVKEAEKKSNVDSALDD